MKNSTDKEYPYEFICKDCGEDFSSKDKETCCAQCSSPNVKRKELKF